MVPRKSTIHTPSRVSHARIHTLVIFVSSFPFVCFLFPFTTFALIFSLPPVTGGHSKQDQILLLIVKIGKYHWYTGFGLYRRSYLLWSPVIVVTQNPGSHGTARPLPPPHNGLCLSLFYLSRKYFSPSFQSSSRVYTSIRLGRLVEAGPSRVPSTLLALRPHRPINRARES